MKKIISILILILVIAACVVFVYPFHIKRICFGDVCPQNGGVYLLYSTAYTKEQCLAKSAYPVEGIGWITVYAGCSPIDHPLSK